MYATKLKQLSQKTDLKRDKWKFYDSTFSFCQTEKKSCRGCHCENNYRWCYYEKEHKVVGVKDRHLGVRNFFTTASFINLYMGAQHEYKVTCPAPPFHSDGDVQMGELTAMGKERGCEKQK